MEYATWSRILVILLTTCALGVGNEVPSLEEVKVAGAKRSSYLSAQTLPNVAKPVADLESFREKIEPILRDACYQCHGAEKQKADFRVDTLDPDLIKGEDQAWWLEVIDVISNGEMPPEDDDKSHFSDEGKSAVIDWLSREIQLASQVARTEEGKSPFRRLTRYEYKYVLQDLLGLPYDFAKDLPPETDSEDGFQNSSEMLSISPSQFQTYRDLARQALRKATVKGEQPDPVYYGLTMEKLSVNRWKDRENRLKKIRKTHQDDPEKLAKELDKAIKGLEIRPGQAHFLNRETGEGARMSWSYGGANGAPRPDETLPEIPSEFPVVAIVPGGQSFIVDIRDVIPSEGNLKVRIRVSGVSPKDSGRFPALRLYFGHQASNNSKAEEKIEEWDRPIMASAGSTEFYEWDIPLGEVIRNPYRGVTQIGRKPNPAEYIKIVNTSKHRDDELHIEYIEIIAPAFEQWPPKSHSRIFISSQNEAQESAYIRDILANFMPRAWRRPVTTTEIDRKVALFSKIRPVAGDFEDAVIEVLATVLSSPAFLYLNQSESPDHELASRLSIFLWSSLPDQELAELASQGKLREPKILEEQVNRMLGDPRAKRFAKHYVHQWLGMQLLEYLTVDKKVFGGQFDEDLRQAMQEEPIALFEALLQKNVSIMDFLHADYIMVNERLARHYRIPDVYGNHFRKVVLKPELPRGGLLTQAGLLAMNSDGKDSHPLKRGIWLLENILHDPPPPPPPAVPEIDLTDPDILKMTLKERMEDHRNDAACFSCHAKIDPWGIAFENYDALGHWRTKVGKHDVDANGTLFNQQELKGMEGLKRYLLEHRQDQFAKALVHKLTTYALGRPLGFSDRAEVEEITAELRKNGDGLRTLVKLIVSSDLFQGN